MQASDLKVTLPLVYTDYFSVAMIHVFTLPCSCNTFVCITHFVEHFDNCQYRMINWTLYSIAAADILVL